MQIEENNNNPSEVKKFSFSVYLSFLEGGVDVFVLLKLLQLGLDQNLSDVHHLLHCQSQTLHWVTELLLEEKHITSTNCPYTCRVGYG